MPIPSGEEHKRQYGAEPRLLVHIGNLRLSDKGDSFLEQAYDPRIRSVSGINTEWAAGDLGLVSDLTIIFNDGDEFLLGISHQIQFERALCEVYHYFVGEASKVLIFKGTIISPVGWSDGDKTFTINVSSSIAGTPLGYSPTKEDIPSLADEAIGQPWPMVFGKPFQSPCVLLSRPTIGKLKDDTPTTSKIIRIENGKAFTQSRPTKDELGLVQTPEPITIQLLIGDEVVQGHFVEDLFHVDEAAYSYREHPGWIENPVSVLHDGWNMDAFFDIRVKSMGDFINTPGSAGFQDPSAREIFIPKFDGEGREIYVVGMVCYMNDPAKPNELLSFAKVIRDNHLPEYGDHQRLSLSRNFSVLPLGGDIVHFCGRIRKGWMDRNNEIYVHSAGSVASVWKGDPDSQKTIYVANAFNTTSIGQVYTKRKVKNSNTGSEQTQTVALSPDSYEIELNATDLGISWPGGLKQAITPSLIKFKEPPVRFMDNEDDPIFCDIFSEVPESSADALKFLLEDWAGLDVNGASFGNANEKTSFTPSHFTVLDIIDVIELSNDIAWQSRSALIVRLGEIFMKYLPVASISDLVTTPAYDFNLIEGSCRIDHTEMSDIVTKYKAKYKTLGSQLEDEEMSTLTITNNEDIYGVAEQEVNIFIYDDKDFVQQTIEWWLKQKSVIWKMFSGSAFLDLMEIDPLDYILIVSSLLPSTLGGSVSARIDKLSFNAQDDTVEFTGWTAIPSGSSNFDPGVISDTVDEGVITGQDVLEDPEDVPPPVARRVHKDQQQAHEDGRVEHGGKVYVVPARVTNAAPDALGRYRCVVYEKGDPLDMDDDTKQTLYAKDGAARQLPLQALGTQRPKIAEHFMLTVTPRGFFYYQPIPRYQ